MRARHRVSLLAVLVALILQLPVAAQNTALNRTTAALLTNKSGGALVYGDVVVLDNTNAKGFTTTTSAGLSTRGLGVILEPNGIANNATGLVAVGGWAPKVNLNTAATVGQFIKTHTVAGQGTPHSSPQVEGDFAVALDASATPSVILFGSANGPSAGGAGDVVGPSSSVASEIALYDGTTGKLLKRATNTGLLKASSGVIATATDGTDYLSPSTAGIVWTQQIITAASQTTVDFTSIPGTASNLQLIWEARSQQAGTSTDGIRLKINNDGTAGNYSNSGRSFAINQAAVVTDVTPTTAGGYCGLITADGNTAGMAANGELFIGGYARTTFHKRATCWGGGDDASNGQLVGTISFRWISTAAITRLTFSSSSGSAFKDGLVWTLYGLK